MMNTHSKETVSHDTQDQESKQTLSAVLEDLDKNITSDTVTIDQIVRRFRHRGFGTLLVVPALITILPTGAIPMVPAICGVVIAFTCFQMMAGREHPWLPKKVTEFSFPRTKLNHSIQAALPVTQKIDKYVYTRFVFLTHDIGKRLTAGFCFLLSLGMIVIGFIPMLPATLALPIFFFGLGYIVKDGVIIALGYLTIIGSYIGLEYFLDVF